MQHRLGLAVEERLNGEPVDQRPVFRAVGFLHAGHDVTRGDAALRREPPRGAQPRGAAEEVEVPLGRLGALAGRDMARPAPFQILTFQWRREQAAIGNPPVRPADTSLQVAKQLDDSGNSARIENPIGVLRVLLETVLHTSHARGEHRPDRPLPQEFLERAIKSNRIVHPMIVGCPRG